MPSRLPMESLDTHEVTNQPPPLVGYNPFDCDPILTQAVRREGAGWAEAQIRALGSAVGSEDVIRFGELANRYAPELRSFDRFGHRIDEVDYHPAYHELMALAMRHGVHATAWTAGRPGGHVAHMALEYLLVQADPGVCCPITMTYASVPTIRRQPEIAAEWEPLVTATAYDPRFIPAAEKSAATIGMAMTEKQGGSDVRTNETRAIPLAAAGPGNEYELTGHKWFCSAPMSDAFITLARTDSGLSCFFVPRWRPDGTRNRFFIQRLKDKLGDRSNASAEIEYNNTWARMIGDDGNGVRTIIEMIHHTRLDTALAAAGMMRQAVVQAVHHASYRSAFGRLLIEQPLMRNVLADMVLEWVAATLMVARTARAYDETAGDETAGLFSRLVVAVAKYWINKRLPNLVYEAMECHGGAGYVEESPMPRLYREAPVNSIWEGCGNVICLDVLRTMARAPASVEALLGEVEASRGADRRLDRSIDGLKDEVAETADAESRARRITESLATVLQAALVVRHAPPAVADAFCASRLGDEGRRCYGTLPAGVAFDDIIDLAKVHAASSG